MSKSAKIPSTTLHKIRVNTLKAELPFGWLKLLQERCNRGQTFVMHLINNHEDWRPEWREVIKLRNEYQEKLMEAERQPL